MPFFVTVELNGALSGGEICWRGQALVEGDGGKYSLVDHAHRACRSITEQDIGKRVFALAIARDKPLSFAVSNIGSLSGHETPRAPSPRSSS
jgi:hypothetical protein